MTKGEKGGKPGVRHYKKRLSVEDVKKRTKCRRCLQKGHWARDCPSTQSFEANFSWSGHLLYLFLFSLYLLCLYLYYLIFFSGDMESHNFCISSEIDDTEYYIMADEGAVV